MDFVLVSESERVRDGLADMLETAGLSPDLPVWIEVPYALLLVELMKVAEDKDEWFPRGKWATIQVLQARIQDQLIEPMEKLGMKGGWHTPNQ